MTASSCIYCLSGRSSPASLPRWNRTTIRWASDSCAALLRLRRNSASPTSNEHNWGLGVNGPEGLAGRDFQHAGRVGVELMRRAMKESLVHALVPIFFQEGVPQRDIRSGLLPTSNAALQAAVALRSPAVGRENSA